MDEYRQACEFLFTQLPAFHNLGAGAYKPGLGNAYTLAEAFGNPHLAFPAIHVAGTNGKGSTSHMLASVLAEAGLKVGLYTSPHIFDFRERIRICGEKIPRQAVVDFTERYRGMAGDLPEGCSPSFFELATIMAFRWMADSNVDVAVIETGLGGRLDTTNIITPLLSVITNVSLDHTDLLGDTPALIAAEKAGIIKRGVPTVIGRAESDIRPVFQAKADECGAPITFVEDLVWNPEPDREVGWIFPYSPGGEPTLRCDLKGGFQRENIATALTALDILYSEYHSSPLFRNISPDAYKAAISRGLENVYRNTGLMGRWTEVRKENPRIICDTGHNPGAWQWLAPMLSGIADKGKLRMVIGFVSDKDVDSVFSMLPRNADYYFVAAEAKRAMPATQLLELARRHALEGRAFPSVDSGVQQAIDDSLPGDTVFIGGSNYVLGSIDPMKLDNDHSSSLVGQP